MPDQVSIGDFQEAIKNVKKAPGGNIKKYEEWDSKFGSAWLKFIIIDRD